MGTIEEELNDYIWDNLSQLKFIFSDKVYSALSKAEDKESLKETIELIMDIDSDFFDSINSEYIKNISKENNLKSDEYKTKGNEYFEKEEYNKALEYYQKALELNPKNYNAYYNIGLVYYNMGKNNKAIENYQKAIEINPQNDEVYNSIGVAYSKKGNNDKAIKFYKKALDLNPKDNHTFHNLNILMTNLNKAFFLEKEFSDLEFKIDCIKIENFKQYKKPFEIAFSKKINIIIGQNAVGKTSLLQAITLGLLKQNSLDAKKVEYEDYISKSENKSEITIYHNDNEERKVEVLKDKREIKEDYFIPFVLAYGSNFFASRTNDVKEVAQDILKHTIHKDFTTSIFMGFTDSFVNPLRLLEYLDLEKDENVHRVQKTLIDTINSFLEGFKLIAREDKNYFFRQEGCADRLSLDELSEGYRGNVLLITDILIKVLGVGYTPDTIEGIILIDEFDKHLHPRWQSKLVSKLTEVFPLIQFIMTTHNPMSILDREADEITMIKEIDGEIKAIKKSVGTKKIGISTILLEYFGVESTVSQTMVDKIDEFTKLKLKDTLTPNDEKELEKLEAFLDETVATNFIYNRAYFNFLKFLKKNKEIDFKSYEELSNEEMESLLNEFKDLFE